MPPYNGFGSASAAVGGNYPAVASTLIESGKYNALIADLLTMLSTALLKDGTQTVIANIPMSGFRLTGLGAGSASGHSIRYEQVNGIVTTVGDLLQATGAGAFTRVAFGTKGDLLLGSGSGVAAAKAVGSDGQLLKAASGQAGGAQWVDNVAALAFIIDGGGSAITTGIKGDLSIPFGCTITGVRLLADQSGSIVVDIWKDTYANYPPTVADTITASAKPTITTATKSEDTTLTGWTTAIAAGDTIRFNVDSITTCQRVTLTLKVTKA